MTSANSISHVRQHLEKFIANAVFGEGAKHLDRSFEIIENLQSDEIQGDIHVLSNMLKTYIERFLSTCRKICQSKTSEAAYIQNLLQCAQSLKENGNMLPEGMVDDVLKAERELKARIPSQEPEISLGTIVQNFLSLSTQEQETALRLLKSLGINTDEFEKARRRHLRDLEIMAQKGMKNAITRMIQGKDDLFIDLLGRRVFEASGYRAETDKMRNFLASSVQVIITGANDDDPTQSEGIMETELPGSEKIYTYAIQKYGIKATMVIQNGSYTVRKGSTASRAMNDSMADGHRSRRQELIRSGRLVPNGKGNLYVFTCDVPFSSPSQASGVISGSSTNGWKCFGIPHQNI